MITIKCLQNTVKHLKAVEIVGFAEFFSSNKKSQVHCAQTLFVYQIRNEHINLCTAHIRSKIQIDRDQFTVRCVLVS